MVCGTPLGYRGNIQNLRRKFFGPGSFATHPTGCARNCFGAPRSERPRCSPHLGYKEASPMSSPAFSSRPSDTAIQEALTDLALDLRWSYKHSADQLWAQLDPDLWELTHNPWVVLQTVSREKLQAVTTDPNFQKLLADLHLEKVAAEESEGWFQKAHPKTALSSVAYFSMQFMLSEALRIHSGGLGNVAGDQLKSASNLGVPVPGVSLLYQQGYFRQEIDR